MRVNDYIVLGRVRVMQKIGYIHMCTHHRKNSATCRQAALGTGSKDTKVKESVRWWIALLLSVCVFYVYVIATVRVSACVHSC